MLFDYNFKDYNFRLLIEIFLLNIIGILVLRSASNMDTALVTKQILGIVVGFVLAIGLSLIDYHKIANLSSLIYIGCLIILAAVLLIGKLVSGATRWIVVPGIGQIQPSEFAKIGLIIFFSWYFNKYQERLNQPVILGISLALFSVPVLLILAEPSLSTSIIIVLIFLSLLFVAGLSYKWIGGAFAVVIPLGALFVYLLQYELIPFLRGYQANRILAFVFPTNPKYQDGNMQQDNSLIAIGSGQLLGKGLNNTTIASVKNGNFLSQEQTDFIFAVIGEELGFRGVMIVLALYLIIIFEIIRLASKAKDLTGRLICVGMAALIAFQSFVNIMVATKMMPNTGQPLPFISAGISSLLSIYIGIGLVLNVGLQRKTVH